MLAQGILIALAITASWIVLQVGALHLFKSRRHFETMALGYLLSLPFVYLAWRHLPLPLCPGLAAGPDESPALGLFHAYLSHFLLFALYFQCFKHVSRSVTLRFLEEIDAAPGHETSLREIQAAYSLDDMVRTRMAGLEEKGYLRREDGRWHNTPKGTLFASLTAMSAALFRSKGQMERGE